MDMTGEQLIPLPRQRVWEALNDPEVLKACIPGCDTIERVSDTEYRIAMTAAVGPVKAKFSGKLLLSDLIPPASYALAFEGSGGAAGFGKGGAKVQLAEEGDATRLTYSATATVGGKLAQIGSRLIDGVARKMAEDFFAKFRSVVTPPVAALPATEASAVPPPAPERPERKIPVWMWIVIALAVALVVAILRKP